MPSAQEQFGHTVIAPLQVNSSGVALSYAEYLHIQLVHLSNDEADVVDLKFTAPLLAWLADEQGDRGYASRAQRR